MHLELEIIKWATILALATALAFAAGRVAGSDEPNRLPPSIDEWALPMGTAPPVDPQPEPGDDVAMQLWSILEDQHAGRMNLAIEGWTCLLLPPESDVWRNIGLAQAYIAMGDVDAAAAALDEAARLRPENAVVHYYLGILHLEQAYRAEEWSDPGVRPIERFASFGPSQVAPNTKGMYRLAAIGELERAIEMADLILLDEPLAPADWPTAAALVPTVGDLLLAIGANHFDIKAHSMLGYLHLENGAPEQAEYHMDATADSGVMVVFGYDDLGRFYEEEGRRLDAFRAYAKSASQGTGLVRPLGKMMENLRKAFAEP
jgi:tetratricopeptide (TPR) repeat protein